MGAVGGLGRVVLGYFGETAMLHYNATEYCVVWKGRLGGVGGLGRPPNCIIMRVQGYATTTWQIMRPQGLTTHRHD